MKKRLLILAIVIAVLAALYFLASSQGWLERFNPAAIYEARDTLKEAVQERMLLWAIGFMLIYFVSTALSVPGASFLTLTGGVLFGPVLSTFLVNVGASGGAVVIFLAARYFMGDKVQEKYGDKLAKFNREMETNGSSYLLTLRFIPIFQFFLINILAGFTTVKLRTFLWTTVVGIIPGSFVYSYLGYAGSILEPGESLLTPEIILALCMLGVISLVPVVYKKVKARNANGTAEAPEATAETPEAETEATGDSAPESSDE